MYLFFFNDTATTEIYTLSLHDALPIYHGGRGVARDRREQQRDRRDREHRHEVGERAEQEQRQAAADADGRSRQRSEEHTSELQSRQYLVCRLLLEKKTPIAHI